MEGKSKYSSASGTSGQFSNLTESETNVSVREASFVAKSAAVPKTYASRDEKLTEKAAGSMKQDSKYPKEPKGSSFPCRMEGCHEEFSTKNRFYRHCRSVHPGEKYFFCDYCSRSFRKYANLYIHRGSHRDRTIRCDFCPKMWKTFRDAMKHMKRCHKDLLEAY